MPGEAGREHKRQGTTPLSTAGAARAAEAREGQVRRSIILSLTLVLLGIAIAACGDTKKGGGPGGPLPYCPPGDLQIPVMFSPADGENIEIPGLAFHWVYNPAGCIPEEYQIQVSQSPTFESYSGAKVDVGVNEWSPAVGLLPATVYYWRMRATVIAGPGPWSPTWTFYTGPACVAASLVAPQADFPAGFMFVLDPPSFRWTYPDDACVPPGYHLQVSASEDFSSIALDRVQPTPSTVANPPSDLENCGVYYWRVAASVGSTDGPFSSAQYFSTNIGAVCSQACTEDQLIAPVPIFPPPYANVGTAPTEGLVPGLLQWGYAMPCFPEGFGIRLSTSRDWSGPSLGGGVSPVTAFRGNWSPADPLEPATQYWWEVFAGIGTTFGPPGPARSFFTGPECESGSDSLPPTLVSPLDGAVVDTLSPWLRYTAGAGSCVPDGYAIYLDTDSEFAGEDAYSSFNFPATTFIPDPLEDCTTYYWRVSPMQDEFVLPWSDDVWSFTTRTGPHCGFAQLLGEAIKESACRYGPGPWWEILGYFVAGERSPIAGRDMSGRWLATDNPDNPGERCWVPSDDIRLLGDGSGMRILNPPLVCKAGLAQTECEAAGGTWVIPVAAAKAPPPPYCQCP